MGRRCIAWSVGMLLASAGCRGTGPEVVRIHPAAVVYAFEGGDGGEPGVFATAGGGVDYRLDGLWRWSGSSWARVSVRASRLHLVRERLSRVAGVPIDEGLYFAAATVNGRGECSLVFDGQVLCNDISLGTVPAGQIATCVPSARGATAMLVTDPYELILDGEPLMRRCAR